MLVLTRKSNESVILNNDIEIKVLGIRGDQVSLGFSAPRNVSIHRREVYDAIQDENRNAAHHCVSDMTQTRKSLQEQLAMASSEEDYGF